MELDLQRFYNINRRILMWVSFFAILYLLRDFFAVMFLTFIMGFVMRKAARFLTITTRLPYRAAVVLPYLVALTLLVLLMMTAIPRVIKEGVEFSTQVPHLMDTLADGIKKTATDYGMEPMLAKYVSERPANADQRTDKHEISTTQPTDESISTEDIKEKLQDMVASVIPKSAGQGPPPSAGELFAKFAVAVSEGTLKFFLAILLSFLIVLDFDRISNELYSWRTSTVGRFFHEAASSLVEFSEVVGTAFQCQLIVAFLNASITCIGMAILGIQPLLLLTTIVFLLGLIPVLGVWISSVPIVLIAFNDYDLKHALLAVGMITIVHLLEAYVFNPRIYAARFHLNPVIVLIILLVGHELFGLWGMLLGIPVTHYVLNLAQVPSTPRVKKKKPVAVTAAVAPPGS